MRIRLSALLAVVSAIVGITAHRHGGFGFRVDTTDVAAFIGQYL